mmetsp:Transcript_29405/g.43775  ORF Transcript_29405/g.43775 Transcript_29405/m.43775 type:complete len:252 (-) Transcript_29405:993-1748(-)
MTMASLALGRVTSAVTRRAVSGSIAGREFSTLLAVTEEFPGLPSTTPTPGKASSASATTLPNGLTVVTEDASSTSTISLTYPGAGSASETASEAGAALANKCLAFKSGSGLSSTLILRNLEDDGATPFATSGRKGTTVGFTAAPDKAVRLMPLLVADCSFEKWDVRDAKKFAATEADIASADAQVCFSWVLGASVCQMFFIFYLLRFPLDNSLSLFFLTFSPITFAIGNIKRCVNDELGHLLHYIHCKWHR